MNRGGGLGNPLVRFSMRGGILRVVGLWGRRHDPGADALAEVALTTVFYASLWFTFADSFSNTPEEPAA